MVEPVHVDGTFSLFQGENRDVLRELPDGSVDCVVTSPPYWSLRDYKLPPAVWGGDASCEHEWGAEILEVVQSGNFNEGMNERLGRASGDRKQEKMRPREVSEGRFCVKCHAWLGQLGLEPTPQLYVEHLVEVFREVWRVLAPHGTAWLNLGDSYMRDHRKGQHKPGASGKQGYIYDNGGGRASSGAVIEATGLKPKDLVMIPHRVAIALQEDGWWVRSDVVWSKPNPMPESVTDRPSKSHEFLFLLAKQEDYFYDDVAARDGTPVGDAVLGRNLRTVWEIPTQPFSAKWVGIEDDDHYAVFPEELVRSPLAATCPREVCAKCGTPRRRIVSRRSVSREELPTDHPEYRPRRYDGGKVADGEHPGTGQRFTIIRTLGWTDCPCQIGLPPDSFVPILTPLGEGEEDDPSMETGRAGFNRPRNEGEGTRVMTRYEQREYAEQLRYLKANFECFAEMEEGVGAEAMAHYMRTDLAGARPIPPDVLDDWFAFGFLKEVELPAVPPGEYRPGRVLDPFCGSGTTGVVARQMNRECWGIELNPGSVRIAKARVAQFHRRPMAPRTTVSDDQLGLFAEASVER